ncbi:methyltetrahydrofolate cobalamin methyltransferase [Desulfosporosinus sp. OT]|uniref:methyltetrahydrofolate cobalamin methyltransferase n=1 Tax=Desulfosporosinus sp. OT TaxID=913865 RepID=UPI000223A1C6|nr:methyltetrahydrofolate cobalamin methyltransferase [Desulfosporosinus sp. OT]EGW37182.1 pterin binding enzyme family protein [Desulfosporosinus sp. OT]
MLIIGELINTSRKAVREAVETQNAEYIRQLAKAQIDAGANYLDVNCGTMIFNELEMMEWLVNTVQEAVEAPLCIDSPNPLAIEKGLSLVKHGQPLINSITAEVERYQQILPLVQKYRAKIVALCMDDTGIPETAEKRMRVVKKLYQSLTEAGIQEEDIYFDPLVTPVSTGDRAGVEVLETLALISKEYPKVHKVCGLSNVSFGLPNRKVLNQLFLVQTMTMGMDSYILDPLDRVMMGFVHGSQALLGLDPYCGNYLSVHRQGLYQS